MATAEIDKTLKEIYELTREGKRKIVFVAFADIGETDRMNKGCRGQNKKRCKFSEKN